MTLREFKVDIMRVLLILFFSIALFNAGACEKESTSGNIPQRAKSRMINVSKRFWIIT